MQLISAILVSTHSWILNNVRGKIYKKFYGTPPREKIFCPMNVNIWVCVCVFLCKLRQFKSITSKIPDSFYLKLWNSLVIAINGYLNVYCLSWLNVFSKHLFFESIKMLKQLSTAILKSRKRFLSRCEIFLHGMHWRKKLKPILWLHVTTFTNHFLFQKNLLKKGTC